MKMYSHIRLHSLRVCQVAVLLTDHLTTSIHGLAAGRSIRLNRDLVSASALLHDITKTRSFETGEDHAATGGQLLDEMGFPEVGAVVRQHVALDQYFANAVPDEAEIVNYADKRVLNTDIVSLSRRMAYILERYGSNADYRRRLRRLGAHAKETENRIFGRITISPDQVASLCPANDLEDDYGFLDN